MQNTGILDSLLPNLGIMLLAAAALYVYFALMITVLAQKTGTPGGWMAWVPIANFLLLCRIGRKPGWLVVLLLIPLVNIVVAVVIWMAVARARGKSPALGILMIVPLLNFVVPLLLINGPPTGGPASRAEIPRQSAPPQGGYSEPFQARNATPVCPACGRPECVGEAFCGYTGQPIAPVAPAPSATARVPSTAPNSRAGAIVWFAVGALVLIGIGYWMFAGGGTKSPKAMQGQLPANMAGTLKEFPIDTSGKPAKPVSVVTRNLRGGHGNAPPNSLPPGISDANLAQVATAATTAVYQTGPGDPPVDVHVLDTTASGPQSQELASRVAGASPSAQTVGVQVASPQGGEYDGYKVSTPTSVTYIFDKRGGALVIIVYAAAAAGIPIADRLAANIGNGNGLNEDSDATNSLAALPAQLPTGVELVDTTTYSSDSMSGSLDQLKSSIGVDFGKDAIPWVEQIRRLLPLRLVSAHYRDGSRRDLNLLLGDYGGPMRAWTTWMMLRATAGLTGMTPAAFMGGDALSALNGGSEYLIFRRGGSLGVAAGPRGGSVLRLAEATQP